MSERSPNNVVRLSSISWSDCRLLVENVADYAVFMLDVSGHVATWNVGAERIKGYTADEIIGEHFSCFFPAADVAAGKPEAELRTATEVGRAVDEGWRVRKDGTLFWANVVITAIRDASGRLRGFGKVTQDLTQRMEHERRLLEAEERFHQLIDAVTDYAIFMLDPQGHVSTWNAGAERAKGYAASEIIGKNFEVFYTAADRAAQRPRAILETVRRDGRYEEEGWRARKDGTLFWANVILTALRAPSGDLLGFAKVTRDLTARRAAEETERRLIREQAAREAAEQAQVQLEESEEQAHRAARAAEEAARRAEDANRLKDEFLATVSHELRTPLNAIVGWSTVLRSRQTDPSVASGIEVIHRNAQAQARLVDDILDVSRIITGQMRLEMRPTNLSDAISEALESVRPSAMAKDVELQFTPPEEVALVVGDHDRLRQVFWNLLSNAVKFTGAGGRVETTIERVDSSVAVCVRDTGRGIEPDFLPHVFERFRQADSSTTRRVGGLGLGLAIVRHIVELHGGRAFVESGGLDQGSRFKMVFPIRALAAAVRSASSDPSTTAASRAAAASTLAGLRVLVVDDDIDSASLLSTVLSDAGAVVECAHSAAEAFDGVLRFQPQMLISDIGMPDEDGYSLVRRIRAHDRRSAAIPSVALSAYTRAEDKAKAIAAGFTTHLGKPVDPNDLLATVVNLAPLAPR